MHKGTVLYEATTSFCNVDGLLHATPFRTPVQNITGAMEREGVGRPSLGLSVAQTDIYVVASKPDRSEPQASSHHGGGTCGLLIHRN